MEKYLIKVSKPAFKTTVVEVEAESEEAAALEGFLQAAVLPDDAWRANKAQDYILDIQLVMQTSEQSYIDDSDYINEIDDIHYLPLKADCSIGEGSVPLQPWLMERDSLLLADVLRDWQLALDAMYDEHLKEHTQALKVIKSNLEDGRSGSAGAKILPFPGMKKH